MSQSTFSPSDLGKGKKGVQPLLFGHASSGNDRAVSRKYLTKAFGNLHLKGLNTSPALNSKNIVGPFRTHFNAGDILVNSPQSTNKIYGTEANQVGGINLARLQGKGDGIHRTGNAMFSGNPRFVYDGSDYARFKKLQAINRNFNDETHGGASNNNNQSIIRKIRS